MRATPLQAIAAEPPHPDNTPQQSPAAAGGSGGGGQAAAIQARPAAQPIAQQAVQPLGQSAAPIAPTPADAAVAVPIVPTAPAQPVPAQPAEPELKDGMPDIRNDQEESSVTCLLPGIHLTAGGTVIAALKTAERIAARKKGAVTDHLDDQTPEHPHDKETRRKRREAIRKFCFDSPHQANEAVNQKIDQELLGVRATASSPGIPPCRERLPFTSPRSGIKIFKNSEGETLTEQPGRHGIILTPSKNFTGILRMPRKESNGKFVRGQQDVCEFVDGRLVSVVWGKEGKTQLDVRAINALFKAGQENARAEAQGEEAAQGVRVSTGQAKPRAEHGVVVYKAAPAPALERPLLQLNRAFAPPVISPQYAQPIIPPATPVVEVTGRSPALAGSARNVGQGIRTAGG